MKKYVPILLMALPLASCAFDIEFSKLKKQLKQSICKAQNIKKTIFYCNILSSAKKSLETIEDLEAWRYVCHPNPDAINKACELMKYEIGKLQEIIQKHETTHTKGSRHVTFKVP